MKIIDAHFHYSNIEVFYEIAAKNGVDYSRKGFIKEAEENQVVAGVCMGLSESRKSGFPDNDAETPMNFDLDEMPVNFYFSAGVNPYKLTKDNLIRLEETVQRPDCVGIKIYGGYYQYYFTDAIYEPVYELALKYDIPVSFHTGDTYSDNGLLKYSHPLTIDELACRYPSMKIVICHLGNPWLMDTAEIVYKNENVYSDLSGLLVGNDARFKFFTSKELFLNMYRTSFIFANRYDKFLYGSDWPLSKMKTYIGLCKLIVPEEHHEKVFYDNALNVYKKMKIS
ncbi:MAG: amidohydrolase family protein [Candidatus Delongbacteria bacterium]|nr:amidohydrolase family protein [Candidatus Delongbacteria bacterium]MCG2760980.1 amidohydrolase family protein [Candidatus Delongbacteria bacterium]